MPKITQAPPIGLPTGSALTGAELIPMDQTVGGVITTIKASASAVAALGGGSGAVQFVLHMQWNSTPGAVLPSLTVPQDVMIPYACVLQQVYISTKGGTGSLSLTLGSQAFPISSPTDITGGTPPVITSASSYSNAVLTGWTTSFAQAAQIRGTLVSSSVFTGVDVYLRFK